MIVTTVCDCGERETCEAVAWRVGESYESRGECLSCFGERERKEENDKWAENFLRPG